jgi:hypothetical protein
MTTHPRRVSLGLSVTALTLLMVELLLVRVFDVILIANIGYVVVTFAMFAMALSGVYAAVRPLPPDADVPRRLSTLALLVAVCFMLLRPTLNASPHLYDLLPGAAREVAAMVVFCGVLVVPYFLGGLIFTWVFTAYPQRIRSLYFWDLAGAAIGCVAFLPFLRPLGPGGLLLIASGLLVLAALLFHSGRRWAVAQTLIATSLVVVPFVLDRETLEFRLHKDKRGVETAQLQGRIEFTEWDPISRIDVVDNDGINRITGQHILAPKHVAYDGGSQSSHFFPFDGNLARLRRIVESGSEPAINHFWTRGVLASHFLKRDTRARVVIFGSAAGQETKAALLFGPAHVDGVELVGTVVRLGKTTYAERIGRLFSDPRVTNRVGEGRSFLRGSPHRYDIIQIFSNHTSSNAAIGNGAGAPVYLQTVEAYDEYFARLTPDGILHINHHFYPRMVVTAAAAWARGGRTNFARHVMVYEKDGWDALPTMLIKMSPWTDGEVAALDAFMNLDDGARTAFPDENWVYSRVVDPLRDGAGALSPAFFGASVPDELQRLVDYDLRPPTDDRPFFNNVQRHLKRVQPDTTRFLNANMADALNARLGWPLGEYTIPVGVGVVGILLGAVLVLLPLRLAPIDVQRWTGRLTALGYFACLGAGYIVVELVLIQLFQKVIGYPLYAYSLVIFTMLMGSALGSLTAERLEVHPARRWRVPFAGVLATGLLLWAIVPSVSSQVLELTLPLRAAVSVAMIAPLAFFMGMPLPLGILALERQPRGAIAWAWGANALFTVIGGVTAGLLGLLIGFRSSLLVALIIYSLAMALLGRVRTPRPDA